MDLTKFIISRLFLKVGNTITTRDVIKLADIIRIKMIMYSGLFIFELKNNIFLEFY